MSENIKIASDFSGVGAFPQSLERLKIDYDEVFACDFDYYSRCTYLLNFGTEEDIKLSKSKDHKKFSDGVKKIALSNNEPSENELIFLHDANEFAKRFSFYFPFNVYDREIPKESVDIYMTSPPCQSFSISGKRLGEQDNRGLLFYNSHEFIKTNAPKKFIFENVKGLLSSKSSLTYYNSLYLLLYNFKKIDKWESLENQKSNLNLLSQNISNYLLLNYQKKLGLKLKKSGTLFIGNSELAYEKLEVKVKSGMRRRLKFLEERICQITKNQNFYQKELIVPLGCKEEDLVLSPEKSYLINNLSHQVIDILEKTVNINANTSLFANKILEDNSKKGKLYTTLMELNLTTESKTFMYVLEMNIIRLIILALDLSSNLWKEIWHILTQKKEFIGLKTFDIWLFNLDHLGYNLYYKVLNAKDYGIPQNRERIFIIGIRDDVDNDFQFPKPFTLEKRLKDILEKEVDEKYFLSEEMVAKLIKKGGKEFISQDTQSSQVYNSEKVFPTLCAGTHGYALGYIKDEIIQLNNPVHSNNRVFSAEGISCTLTTMDGGNRQPFIYITSNTNKGFDEAEEEEEEEEDSINFSIPSSTTRRGRVGKKVAQTLDTQCNQGIYTKERIRRLTPLECFRLMDFNFGLEGVKNFIWDVSDTQAYKQAGNSICVGVLTELIKKLKL